jgi:hypothetical protein
MILLVFALVLFILAGFGVSGGRLNLVALGLACIAGAMLLGSNLNAN